MRCPNCGTINPPQAKFCLECGIRFNICPNCGTFNLPQAKFCIECGTSLRENISAQAVVSEQGPTGTTGIANIDERGVVPAVVEGRIATPDEERRLVTVMFADIIGSTPLADRLDPEDMRAILTGYFNLMTRQIRKHDGTVEKYIGDAVMAVFGVPIAHEDDADRAIRAALDMQTALAQFNTHRQTRDPAAARLQMRIGINTGEVAAPGSNGQPRQDFLVTGDAVNIAARLQQVAAPDSILVGERTYLAARDVFAFQSIPPLHVKGKTDAIAALVVLGLRPNGIGGQERATTGEVEEIVDDKVIALQHQRGVAGRSAPLVGRSLELTLLQASYARVQAERHPHLITILGTPGIGKSRLVREFITREQEIAQAQNRPLLELEGRCLPYGEGITYWPLIEILRSLLHISDSETSTEMQAHLLAFLRDLFARSGRTESAEEIAETLLRRIGLDLAGQETQNREQRQALAIRADREEAGNKLTESNLTQGNRSQGALLRAWRVLLEALGEQQPLIIVLDDLQWADDALLELLEYLTERITMVPILFLCPARPDFLELRRDWGGGHRNFTMIELESLSWEESGNLVDELLHTRHLPETLRVTILARAEGNPFFVEEIVRMLIDQGTLVHMEGGNQAEETWYVNYPDPQLMEEMSQQGEYPEEDPLNTDYLAILPHVPDTVQGVLAARIDLLEPVEKVLLQHASIIGRSFWLSSLQELARGIDTDAILLSLVALIRRGFLVELEQSSTSSMIVPNDQFLSFKHILIHDVVYSTIPRQRRAREHAQLAAWLEKITAERQDAFIEVLAYHYQQALSNWSTNGEISVISIFDAEKNEFVHLTRANLRDKAMHYLTLTGNQAMRNYYSSRAVRAYSDAFGLLDNEQHENDEYSRMLEKLGDAYTQRGNFDAAWLYYRRALQSTDRESKQRDESRLINLYEELSLLATRWLSRFDSTPDPQETYGYIQAGLRILENKPLNRKRIAFLTYQAFWYIRQFDGASAEQKTELADQAMVSSDEALKQAEELGSPWTLSLALDATGFIYQERALYTKALEIQERRLQIENLSNDHEEMYDLAASLAPIYEQVGDYTSALHYYGQALSHAQVMESPSLVLRSMVGRMRTWRQWNRWNDAKQVAQDILRFIEQYQQDEKRQFWALETLATIAYHRGEQEEGEQYAYQCKQLLDQQNERDHSLEKSFIQTRMHTIHVAQRDLTRATIDYQEKLRAGEPFPTPEILSTLAELLVKTRASYEEQKNICERAIHVGELSGAKKSLGVAYRARGSMFLEQEDWSQAEADLRQSLTYCQELDLPWEQAHTLYALGLLYQRLALSISDEKGQECDYSRARHYLEQALGFYASLKAIPSVTQTRQLLAQIADVQSPAQAFHE